MDADWSKVTTVRAPAEKSFANRFLARGWIMQGKSVPSFLDGMTDSAFAQGARMTNVQVTGGSTAVRFTGREGMRWVGAAARDMLVRAAAREWNAPVSRLTVAEGVVTDPETGQTARFGELAEAASRFSPPQHPRLKAPSEWRIAGTSPPRLDIPAKTNGTFPYGIDLKLPDMIHAAVRTAPVRGARLVSVDPAPAQSRPGVEQVVSLDNAVAVLAPSWWTANQALLRLRPEFASDGAETASETQLESRQGETLSSENGDSVVSEGNAARAIENADPARVVSASYRVPHLHHAAMEPINVTAQYVDGVLIVWAGEQDALGTKALLAQLSGLSPNNIIVHGLPAGGSYGRRVPQFADYMSHVPPIAMAASPRPVKLILSREEEFTHGAYRPGVATEITAALDAEGRPTAWSQRYLHAAVNINEGFELPYEIENQSIRSIDFATHLQTGVWRSVANSQHGFWKESFIDELAHAAGRDPFEYRRDLLPEGSRGRRVLETAAERAGWGDPLPAGRGRGIALVHSFGTWVAQVTEASVGAGDVVRVHKVTAVVDCGGVVHPNTAAAQVEGGIIMGLSSALRERITLDDGAIAERNFPQYPVMRLADAPEIDVHFLESDGEWGGLGEPGVPPAAPALANAIFAATGRRVRRLPIVEGLAEA
jgi:isoquinoline 1-oxidoreductase beta subunit